MLDLLLAGAVLLFGFAFIAQLAIGRTVGVVLGIVVTGGPAAAISAVMPRVAAFRLPILGHHNTPEKIKDGAFVARACGDVNGGGE
jgi:hypothetical protein